MPSDETAEYTEGVSRRDFALGFVSGSALIGAAWGAYEAFTTVSEDLGRSIENSGRWLPEDGPAERSREPATIKSVSVEPNSKTVEDYSSFKLKAEYETGTKADTYHLPTIHIVDSAAGSVATQSPMEELEPGTSGTWEMGFVDQSVASRTTVIVHMNTAADSFEVVRR